MSGQEPRDTSNSSLWVAVSSAELPAKKYFKIGEVAQLVGVEPHVLRYWQTQFPQVRPQKSRSGHRLYRRRDVETLLAIRELLHVQRFTIAGAKQALRGMGKNPSEFPFETKGSDGEEMPTAYVHSIDAFRALSEQNDIFEVESLEDDADVPTAAFTHARVAADGGMRDNIRPPIGTTPRPHHRGAQAEADERTELAEIEIEGLGPHALLEAMERQLAESYQRDVIAVPYEAQLFGEISWQKEEAVGSSLVDRDEAPVAAFLRRGGNAAEFKSYEETLPGNTSQNGDDFDGTSGVAEMTTLDAATASFVDAHAHASVRDVVADDLRDALSPGVSVLNPTTPADPSIATHMSGSQLEQESILASSPEQAADRSPQAAGERKSKGRGEQLGFGFTPTSKATLEAARSELKAMLSLLHQSDVESRRAFHVGGIQRNADRTTEL